MFALLGLTLSLLDTMPMPIGNTSLKSLILLSPTQSVLSRRTQSPVDDELSQSLSKTRVWPRALEIKLYYYQSDGLIFHIYCVSKDTEWISDLLSANLKLQDVMKPGYSIPFEDLFDDMIRKLLRTMGQYYTRKDCIHSDITHFGLNFGLMQLNYERLS